MSDSIAGLQTKGNWLAASYAAKKAEHESGRGYYADIDFLAGWNAAFEELERTKEKCVGQ